jgi:hypothetical protein
MSLTAKLASGRGWSLRLPRSSACMHIEFDGKACLTIFYRHAKNLPCPTATPASNCCRHRKARCRLGGSPLAPEGVIEDLGEAYGGFCAYAAAAGSRQAAWRPMRRERSARSTTRPGRWGEKVIQFVVKPKRLSLMEYLYYAGDDRFGALGISTSSSTYSPQAASPLPRLDDAQQLSEVAAKIEASEPISELEAKIIRAGGSLGGAKPKALIEIGDEQWVIKFFNGESVDTPLSVSKCDIVSLAKRIDDELLTQRIGFDQARFQSGPAKRKRSSPFRRA